MPVATMRALWLSGRVKCVSCNGNLEGLNPFCPFCGSRQQVDLRTVNQRNLGTAQHMSCPRCESSLEIWSIETANATDKLEVERCAQCYGLFFNPGELETFLHSEIVDTVWLDHAKMEAMRPTESDPLGRLGVRERHYLPCPTCKEIMNSQNFGRRSGVLVDLCRHHGIWLDGGELQKLSEWWRAGGKHIHQANETEKAQRLATASRSSAGAGAFSTDVFTDVMETDSRRRETTTFDLLGVLGLIAWYFWKLS